MTIKPDHPGIWKKMLSVIVSAGLVVKTLAAALGAPVPSGGGLTGAVVIESQEAVEHVPIRDARERVAFAVSPVRPDGDLAEWKAAGIRGRLLVGEKHATWTKGLYGGATDLAVSVSLCRDDRHLYLAIEADDDCFPSPGQVEVAFAPNDSKLITEWRDVGMRYGADDVHITFGIASDLSVQMSWAHLPHRIDSGLANNSFGTEAERRAFLEQSAVGGDSSSTKVLARAARRVEGKRVVTVLEAAFPWKLLAPYVPVSFAPLKCNVAVHDKDDGGGQSGKDIVAWMPGLVGTYSAAHFATLEFDHPASRQGVESHAQVSQSRFVNQDIGVLFSFFNHSETTQPGHLKLALISDDVRDDLATSTLPLPPGFSQKLLSVHSEKIGRRQAGFVGRLQLDNSPALEIPVQVSTLDDTVAIQPIQDVLAKVSELDKQTSELAELCRRADARGLDMAYPLAHKTLLELFLGRCQLDIKAGDAERVLRNCAYLDAHFRRARNYIEEILKYPATQLRVPQRVPPEHLRMKEGYWFDGNQPVFLWGPCTFWYLRQDQSYVAGLGFNSVCPEQPLDPDNAEAVAHLEEWRRLGLAVHAGLGVPNFQAILKEHPEFANLDQNNFLPFLIQHPTPRQAIAEHYRKSISFYGRFPGILSYWLWNEPWYLNYSETTRHDFIMKYLQPRYKTIESLNARWRSEYKSFDDVKLVQWPDFTNTAPWYDFQQFRNDLLSDFLGFLHKTARDAAPGRPTHTKFMAASLHSFNLETFQAPYEIAGFDGSMSDRDIVFLDFCRSLYPDHPLANTEIHIHYGGRKDVELVPWRLALHGLASGNWWCWHSNPRFSDSLGNAESMHALAFSGLDVRRLFHPYIHALIRKPSKVVTLFPDVVERRSDLRMVRTRLELAAAQYALGLQPFYSTESRITQGELARHKILLAGESDHVRESTYQGILNFARNGGTVIVTLGGFARNEYGDSRDAGELVRATGGESYGPGTRTYPLGKGHVICLDTIVAETDVVQDGGQVLRDRPLPEHDRRRFEYQRVLDRILTENGLRDPVRLVATDASKSDPQALYGVDWRCAKVEGNYVLAVLPYAAKPPFTYTLATDRPVRKITNLITGRELSPDSFTLEDGPNLFLMELEAQ